MLVLSRRERERIRLGDSIVVTVVRLSGDRVRLGIEAPADVLVLRDELDDSTLPRAADGAATLPSVSDGVTVLPSGVPAPKARSRRAAG